MEVESSPEVSGGKLSSSVLAQNNCDDKDLFKGLHLDVLENSHSLAWWTSLAMALILVSFSIVRLGRFKSNFSKRFLPGTVRLEHVKI